MRMAIVLTLFTLLILFSGCVNEEPSKSTPTPETPETPTITPTPLPHPTPTPVPGIAPTPLSLPLSVETDKSSYLPGEKVEIRVSIENNLGSSIRISPFPPEVRIEGKPSFKPAKVFPSGSKEVKLKPGQVISFSVVWDLSESKVLPGTYDIMIWDVKVVAENRSFGFAGFGKTLLIVYPQGSLNKTLELNLSKGEVTLQKIEFKPEESRFYLQTNIPVEFPEVPGNIPPPFPTPPDALTAYSAELRVDGKQYPIRPSDYKPDGKWTVIFLANPLPSDAKMLELVVRNSGFWKFNVSLE